MAIVLLDQLVLEEKVLILLGSTATAVSAESVTLACEMALGELHWTLPLTDPIKCFWTIERAKRYTLFVLLTESAYKFRFKEIHLHNRFAQYQKLIEYMDKMFAKALEDNSELFDTDNWGNFGEYISSGFVYDYLGNDITL